MDLKKDGCNILIRWNIQNMDEKTSRWMKNGKKTLVSSD
jgi:hypothetical protein